MQRGKENETWLQPRAAVIAGMVVLAAALRVIPHPMNFAPIGAMALFSGAYFSSKRAAVLVPLAALAAGDCFTGFHELVLWVYASFLASVAIGFWLRRKKSAARIGAATVAGAIQFFLITNFAVWFSGIGSYSKTPACLAECYVRGLPLLGNTLAADAFYAALLFGGMALAERRFPSLREPLAAMASQNSSLAA
jgi:uncharacterized membrane protein